MSVSPPNSANAAFPATSPCIKVCILDLQEQCRGCRRAATEIEDWPYMTLDERQAVNARLGFRGHDESR